MMPRGARSAAETIWPEHICWRMLRAWRAGKPIDEVAIENGVTHEEVRRLLLLAMKTRTQHGYEPKATT